MIFDEITSGAQSDIKQATNWARKMVTDLGMSDKLGPRTFGDKQELVFLGREISEQKDYSEKTADAIDKEVNRIISEAHDTARKILTENRAKLVEIAEKLITEETLEGEELDKILGVETTTKKKPAQAAAPAAETETDKQKAGRRVKKSPILPDLSKQAPATPD
jgi:cell division protease FtsH